MVDIFEERTTKDLKFLIYLKKELRSVKVFKIVDIFEERNIKDLKFLIYLKKRTRNI